MFAFGIDEPTLAPVRYLAGLAGRQESTTSIGSIGLNGPAKSHFLRGWTLHSAMSRETRGKGSTSSEKSSVSGEDLFPFTCPNFNASLTIGVMLDLYSMSADANPRTILRIEGVFCRTGLKRTMLYDLIAKGEFPKQVPLGARAVGWYEDEVQDWIDERPAVEGRAGRSCNGIKGARPNKRTDHETKNGVEKKLTTAVETAHGDALSQSQKAKPAHRRTSDAAGGKSATAPSDAGELEELRRMRFENSKLKVMLADLMLEIEALRSALADKPAA